MVGLLVEVEPSIQDVEEVDKASCARCQILDQLSPYKLHQNFETDINAITHLMVSSNNTLKTTQLNISYERNYDEDYEMGPISQFLENLILHSMSTKVMDTPAQSSIEELGGSVKCEVNQFKISFTYILPLDVDENRKLLRLCKEDIQTRMGTPSMVTKRPEDLIPYMKSKLGTSYEIWNHVLLSKIWSEKNPPVKYATLPLIEDSALINKMKNIIMADEAVRVATKMNSWRVNIILQSKLEKDDLIGDFEKIFGSFCDLRKKECNHPEGKYSFVLPESTFCIVNTPVSCATSVMMTWPIPIDRLRCTTAYHLIFDAIFGISNLKKATLYHPVYDIKIHSQYYASFNNILHLVLTIEIGSMTAGVSMGSLTNFILNYLETLLNDQAAIEKIIAIYHQKLNHLKFHSSCYDIDEVSNQMLCCHGTEGTDHVWQDHLSMMYRLGSFEELFNHFRSVVEFLLETKFTAGLVTCLYKTENESSFDCLEKYTGSMINMSGKIRKVQTNTEFDWAATIFPRIICLNSNPKMCDSYPVFSNVKDTDSYSLNEISNNIYSHHHYVSIRISPHSDLKVYSRYYNVLNLIIKNAVIIVAELEGFNPMAMGVNFDSFMNDYSWTLVFQSDHKLELPIIDLILNAIHRTPFALNESTDLCDQALKRAVDIYREAKNLPEGHDNLLPNLISDWDLDNESSISFIKTFNKTRKIKIISAAYLSTCKIDITISTPSGTRPLTLALEKKLTELFQDFDQARGYAQNVKCLRTYQFKDTFLDIRKSVDDEDLLREKISKHFAIIGSMNIKSVVDIVPHGSCYTVRTLFQVANRYSPSDDAAISAVGEILNHFVPIMLKKYISSQNDKPADLNLIKIKVEILQTPSVVLQVRVDFVANNFIDVTKYLFVKIGNFLSQTKACNFDIENFLEWKHKHHLTESAELDELRIFSEICEHFIIRKNEDSNKDGKPRVHWYGYDSKLDHDVIELMKPKPSIVNQYIDQMLTNLSLAYVYQQRPVCDPHKLASQLPTATAISINVDTELEDNPDMVKERRFFMQTMPLLISKSEKNKAKFTTVHKSMQPKDF